MSEPSRPSAPVPRPSSPTPGDASASMRDRLGELARRRVARPVAIRVLYAAVALFAVVYFVGTLAGWWGSPVADKVRERRERDARAQPGPAAPPAGTPR